MNRLTLLDPVPVRFSPELKRRLALAQRRFNLNASEIIRRAVEQKLPEWERSGAIVLKGRPRKQESKRLAARRHQGQYD